MRTWTRWGVALAASAALTAFCGGAQAQNAAGNWHGTFSLRGGDPIPIGVSLKAKSGGDYEGSFVFPKKDRFPLVGAKVDQGTLSFSYKPPVGSAASYSGRWDEARKAWVGQITYQVMSGGPSGSPQPVPGLPGISAPLVLIAGKP